MLVGGLKGDCPWGQIPMWLTPMERTSLSATCGMLRLKLFFYQHKGKREKVIPALQAAVSGIFLLFFFFLGKATHSRREGNCHTGISSVTKLHC